MNDLREKLPGFAVLAGMILVATRGRLGYQEGTADPIRRRLVLRSPFLYRVQAWVPGAQAPTRHTLYGADVYVHPEARGLAIGHQLYEARRQLCRSSR